MIKNKIIIIFLLLTLVSCSVLPIVGSKKSQHKIMLEPVGTTQIRQLYIDGFEKLSKKEKIFAYYITQAGIAGRDIFYDQNHKQALEIRNFCEEILTHSKCSNNKFQN